MALATLSIDIVAKLASFEQDMGRVTRVTEKNAAQMQRTLDGVANSVRALGAGVSVAATVAFVRNVINGVDALNDLRDATFSSIENISALEDVAARTGTRFETVSTALIKFNGALKDAKPGDAISDALDRIGLKADELRKLDPAEALLKTAVALSTYKDDGDKARLVQELFGKSLREVAPLLKDLADKGQLNATITAKQAEEAERFNNQLNVMAKNSTDAARALLNDFLPVMNKVLQNYLDIKAAGGLGTVIKDAAKDMIGLGKLTGDNAADINNLLAERVRLTKDLQFAEKKGFATRDIQDKLDDANMLLTIVRIKQRNAAVAGAENVDSGDAVSRAINRNKRSVGPGKGPAVKDAKDGITDAQRALGSYVGELEKAIEKNQDLTEVQIANNRLAAMGTLGQIPQVRELVLGLAAQRDATKELAEREKDLATTRAKIGEISERYLDGLIKDNDGLVKNNETMRLALEEMGLQADALDRLRLVRLDAALAQERENLIAAQNIDGNEAEIAQIERRIRLKEIERGLVASTAVRRVEVEEQDAAKKRQESLSNSINDGILDGFRRGKSAGDVFIDELKAQFGKTILSPIIKPIADFGANIITSGLGALAGAIGLPKFATGISYVPHDMAAIIHKGERVLTAPENKSYGQAQAVPVFQQQFIIGDVASKADVMRAVRAGNQATIAAWNRRRSYGGADS